MQFTKNFHGCKNHNFQMKNYDIYAPNFEKVGSILLGFSVRPSVRSRARVLKFYIWIPYQNVTYPYFFLVRIISPCRVMALLRGKYAIL